MKLDKAAREAFRRQGKIGGQTRAAKLTPEQRRAISQHANRVRWDRVRAEKEAKAS